MLTPQERRVLFQYGSDLPWLAAPHATPSTEETSLLLTSSGDSPTSPRSAVPT